MTDSAWFILGFALGTWSWVLPWAYRRLVRKPETCDNCDCPVADHDGLGCKRCNEGTDACRKKDGA